MLRLDTNCIILNLQATGKEGVLQEMTEVLQNQCPQIDLEILRRVVREREIIGSTGVGNGIAIPHGKVGELEKILYCFGRSEDGIGFDAIDNQPVHYFFMILAPLNMAGQYLKTLASASRLLKQPEIKRQLRLATNKQELIDIFQQTG